MKVQPAATNAHSQPQQDSQQTKCYATADHPLHHRVDSGAFVEISNILPMIVVIIRRKKIALINLNWNFTEVIRANEFIPENLVALHQLREIYLYKIMEQPITALQTLDCDLLLHWFIEVNFSKLTDSNQIFRNDFVGLQYHLCKISSKIIECISFMNFFMQLCIITTVIDLNFMREFKFYRKTIIVLLVRELGSR